MKPQYRRYRTWSMYSVATGSGGGCSSSMLAQKEHGHNILPFPAARSSTTVL